MPLPPFGRTYTWISIASVHLMHMAGLEGAGGREGREDGTGTPATGFNTARWAG